MVVRVGDASSASYSLGNARPVYLDEYNVAAAGIVQSIAMPTAASTGVYPCGLSTGRVANTSFNYNYDQVCERQ